MSSSRYFPSTVSPLNLYNCPPYNNTNNIKYCIFVKIIIIPC